MSKVKKVLIVDDAELINTVLGTRLTAEGYEVISAYNGEDGVKKALEEDPDLILLDVMMPGMDGFEVLKVLRRDNRTKKKPVIMFTAQDKATPLLKGKNLEITDYIVKPFNAQDVLEKIKKYV